MSNKPDNVYALPTGCKPGLYFIMSMPGRPMQGWPQVPGSNPNALGLWTTHVSFWQGMMTNFKLPFRVGFIIF